MTKKIIIGLAVVFALGLGILYARGLLSVHQDIGPPASLAALKLEKSPQPASAVVFTDARGAAHSLADYRGRYVLLNMWATWCAPCVAELPALAKLKAAVPGLAVLAVDMTGHSETAAMAEAFLKDHDAAGLGPLVDTRTMLMRAFTVAVMPTTVLIDPNGKVVARAEGAAEWAAPSSVAYFRSLK